MKTRILVVLAGVSLCFVSVGSAAERNRKDSSMSRDMRRAIAFERGKDRADARQARIEARHPSVTYTTNSANRSVEASDEGRRKVKDPGERQYRRYEKKK